MEVNAVDRESAVPCDAHPCKRGVDLALGETFCRCWLGQQSRGKE
jgi:hypothetical protein